MVLEGLYGVFRGVTLVYVWGYDLVIDFPVLLYHMPVFGVDFIIDDLEVAL